MMNPEIKIMWVATLRSGNYEQGTGLLRDDDNQFCCLGVLCDLMPDAAKRWNLVDEQYVANYRFDGTQDALPESVMTWASISFPDPEIIHIGYTLSTLKRRDRILI
jgi:hypothetical protein